MQKPMSANDLLQHASEMEAAGKTLLDTAKQMREAAAVFSGLVASSGNGQKTLAPRQGGRKSQSTKEQTRLEQLTEFVLANGPITRRDAKAMSGIPAGTVGTLLTQKNFQQMKDGKWMVKNEKAS